jgi:allophanate hydrolase subunit 2
MVTGSVQVPPNGLPVLLLADHPTTGGYPVIAVALEDDLHHAAQAAPGTTVRFRLRANPARRRT